ncbi:cytochrome c biogenesis protein CcsA [PVC group bacterium]|nr:cytochrome c biogenesis protein CcsA [PVC group bacterium]
MNQKQKFIHVLFLTISLVFTGHAAHGSIHENNVDSVNNMLVLHEGRIKPMGSLARNLLLQFSGRTRYQKHTALEWFVRLILTPSDALDDRVFLINHPEIPQALGLSLDKHRRYSFRELYDHIGKLEELAQMAFVLEDKERSLVEAEIMRVMVNLKVFMGLAESFQFAYPHEAYNIADSEVLEFLGFASHHHQLNFLKLFRNRNKMSSVLEGLDGTDSSKWTNLEKSIYKLSQQMFYDSHDKKDLPLKIIPIQGQDETLWLSPWEVILLPRRNEKIDDAVDQLEKMLSSYINHDPLEFQLSVRAFNQFVYGQIQKEFPLKKIRQENIYNALKPFFYSKVFYGLGLLVCLLSLLAWGRSLGKVSLSCLLLGSLIHLAGIVLRILIMSRPPVSTLYETFVFVGWMSVVLALAMEFFNRDKIGLLVGNFAGLVFLMIAGRYAAEGDTLVQLVAVLNSNFWLATHVLSITTGYAGVCVAGILGHLYLITILVNKSKYKQDRLEKIYRTMLGALGFGLTVTFIGTMLGGIWADQSWGRFWGWDPKENGALLIVLWCSIIFHAKAGDIIGPLGVAVGSIFGIIVVMMAWFGVNLLGVGLHSYGFASGTAIKLGAFTACEVLFMFVTYLLARKRLGVKL